LTYERGPRLVDGAAREGGQACEKHSARHGRMRGRWLARWNLDERAGGGCSITYSR
jgi:hypothetical protein